VSDAWQPEQYARFRAEREQPFHDLLALVRPVPGGRAVDLGCGTGVLTRLLHERTEAVETVGVDRSEAMLAQSAEHAGGGVRFEQADIGAFDASGFDVVFSNAALQWVDDHEALFPRLANALGAGGQLAVQMPMNHDHPSHTVAHEVAREPRHAEALGGYVRGYPLREAEWYATLLARLGFEEQHVRLQVYLHRLAGPEEVVEWVKGSLLTDYRKRLSPEQYEAYLADYRARLLEELPDERPHLYPFKRNLLWGRLPGDAPAQANG
jgi:trans-aconitate 2-methyltransferase